MSTTFPAIDVVIPAKDAARLLPACLDSLVGQLDTDRGDRVIVVDDGSNDDTVATARAAGAHVVANDGAPGPYGARNSAVRQGSSDWVVFVDVRSRALPGLLDAHRTLLSGSALSCTNVRVLSGRRLAERVSAVSNMFDLQNYVGVSGQLPYFPTCNLGVRRDVFAAAGGFRAVRSGGDADLCWRVQRTGLGTLGVDERVLMTWQPRTSVRSLVEQSYRYGKGHSSLPRAEDPDAVGAPAPSSGPSSGLRVGRVERLRERLRAGDTVAVAGAYALALPLAAGRLSARAGSGR